MISASGVPTTTPDDFATGTRKISESVDAMQAAGEMYLTHALSIAQGIDKLRRAGSAVSLYLAKLIGRDLMQDKEFARLLAVYDGAAEFINESVEAVGKDIVAMAGHMDEFSKGVHASLDDLNAMRAEQRRLLDELKK